VKARHTLQASILVALIVLASEHTLPPPTATSETAKPDPPQKGYVEAACGCTNPAYSKVEPEDSYITRNNETLTFRAKFDAGLNTTMSKARFCWNATVNGVWLNSTYQTLNGSVAQVMWFNITRTMNTGNNQGGFWVKWTIQANSSADNFNSTSLRYFYYWEIFPSSTSKQDLGSNADSGWTSNCYNALATGGRDGQYVSYLNTSDEWVYVRAYDVTNGNWTPNIRIVDVNSTDSGHWLPAIGFLPDGRALIAWGYANEPGDPLSVRTSTYSANTEANLTKLLSSWSSIIRLAPPLSNDNKGFSYPHIFDYGSNSTCIYARDGSSTFSGWVYIRWVNKGWADCYVKTYAPQNVTRFSTNGTAPYANEEQFNYVYGQSGIHSEWIGNWTFRTQNTQMDKEMYVETWFNKVYVRLLSRAGNNLGATLDPDIWNGTAWHHLSTVPLSTSYAWYSWDVSEHFKTAASLENAQLRIGAQTVGAQTTIEKIHLRCNITGFAPPTIFCGNGTARGAGAWGTSYLNFHKLAGKNTLYVSGEQCYSVSGEYYRRNAIAFYTNNSGYNWYRIDGSALGTGYSFRNNKAWIFNATNPEVRDARYYPCYNADTGIFEINSVIWNYSLPKESFRNEISYYNKTVGTSGGSWIHKNCTWANNETELFRESAPMQYYGFLYFDRYYNRPAFWNCWKNHLCLFVQSPASISKWQLIYENTTYTYGRTWGRELYESTTFYNTIVHAEILICGFYSSFGNSASNASQGVAVTCRFQASYSMKATGVLWWVNPTASGSCGQIYADVALYDASFNRLAYSTMFQIYQGAYLNWWTGASFTTPVSVTSGKWYYLCFRVTSANSHTSYLYDSNTTANQCYEKNVGVGAWPPSLSGGTVRNRKVNVVLTNTVRQVWGLGKNSCQSVPANPSFGGGSPGDFQLEDLSPFIHSLSEASFKPETAASVSALVEERDSLDMDEIWRLI
jgi:hypothetical protein